ncbi:hypothetical protein HID58_023289, partial [Brassica napus]
TMFRSLTSMETERVKRKLGGSGVAETTTSTVINFFSASLSHELACQSLSLYGFRTERVALWWWYGGGAYASAHRKVKTKLNCGASDDDDEIWILI